MRPVRVIVTLLFIAGLGFAGAEAWDSSALRLVTVEVAGNVHVTKEEVAAASGLSLGVHLLKISSDSVERMVERLAWVKHARVERVIPSTVRITVTERTPAAQLVVSDGTFIADEEGVLLGPAPSVHADGGGLVTITGLTLDKPEPGMHIGLPQYEQALLVSGGVEPAIRERLIRIRAPTVDGIALELSDGLVITFGAAEDLDEKNLAIRSVIAEADARGERLASIDVRVPRRPSVRAR